MPAPLKDAAKFLKNTLRLPSSSFPPRPRPADLARYLPRCTDDLYAWQSRERPATGTFILHDGPPYANGDLHVGHALNKIIKDIICRSRLAFGQRVNYVPGWDCHGLPIELKALEKHGWARGQDVDPVMIRSAARKFAYKTVEKQMAGFRSWAVMGDWHNHWKTMQKDFELRQLGVFQALAESGLIYRKNKPVYWSPSSGTALAEAELEYQDDHVSTAALVKYPLINSGLLSHGLVHALIWTTTPWTLPANQAIAINSSLTYCLIKSPAHGLLVVAQSRLRYLQETMGEEIEVILDSIPTEQLLQSRYSGLPVFGPEAANRPIYHADFVSAESGTGLVHCAPGHGMEDYGALQPLISTSEVIVKAPVDNLGRFNEHASPEHPSLLSGQDVFKEGNKSVLTMLESNGLLVHQHEYKHKYPIDWRTKEPIIIRATAQWFADVSKIKADSINSLQSVKFFPETGAAKLRSFIENRSEWCISRQRAWGVPIPAIYHKSTGEAILTSNSIKHIIGVIEQRGIDAWWSDPTEDSAWILPGLPGHTSDYVRGKDTMDVWFDSGTSWTSLLKDKGPQSTPLADVYVEGTDQHRGWFQSSLLTNIAHQKASHASTDQSDPTTLQVHAPFRTLATHGFTLDAKGKKMSKSIGNVIAPDQIISGLGPTVKPTKQKREIHPLGPDALRLWAASSDWTRDVVISETVVSAVHSTLDKYRLTMKMLLGMLADFDPLQTVPYDKMARLDQIALLHLHQTSEAVRKSYIDFEFHKVNAAISRWVMVDLSSFYFEAVKDIIYCESGTSARRMSAQTVLHHIFQHFQNMLGPINPLLVEESWEHSPETYRAAVEHPLERVWTSLPPEWHDPSLAAQLPNVMAVNSAVKSTQEVARNQKLLGQSLASDVVVHSSRSLGLSSFPESTWKEILVVSNFELIETDEVDLVAGGKDECAAPAWSFSNDIVASGGQRIGRVVVQSPADAKCARCWRYMVETPAGEAEGADAALQLCKRCSDVVAEFKPPV
jgi:isoleucyl-tRNA synthetase